MQETKPPKLPRAPEVSDLQEPAGLALDSKAGSGRRGGALSQTSSPEPGQSDVLGRSMWLRGHSQASVRIGSLDPVIEHASDYKIEASTIW